MAVFHHGGSKVKNWKQQLRFPSNTFARLWHILANVFLNHLLGLLPDSTKGKRCGEKRRAAQQQRCLNWLFVMQKSCDVFSNSSKGLLAGGLYDFMYIDVWMCSCRVMWERRPAALIVSISFLPITTAIAWILLDLEALSSHPLRPSLEFGFLHSFHVFHFSYHLNPITSWVWRSHTMALTSAEMLLHCTSNNLHQCNVKSLACHFSFFTGYTLSYDQQSLMFC